MGKRVFGSFEFESSNLLGSRYLRQVTWSIEILVPALFGTGMLEVLLAVTGESIAEFEDQEIGGVPVKVFKQRLGRKLSLSRFRLRLLHNDALLDDDQTLTLQVIQLVVSDYLPRDEEQEERIMNACEENDQELLEQVLNQPRSPNFTAALSAKTPLYVACAWGSVQCISLLVEANATIAHGCRNVTPLMAAAGGGHLESVRFLLESDADGEQCRPEDGTTPLIYAAEGGHLGGCSMSRGMGC